MRKLEKSDVEYLMVAYTDLKSEKMLFRSEEPMEVQIETEDFNRVTIPALSRKCVSTFCAYDKAEMKYAYGVLYIKGGDAEKPYVVAIM